MKATLGLLYLQARIDVTYREAQKTLFTQRRRRGFCEVQMQDPAPPRPDRLRTAAVGTPASGPFLMFDLALQRGACTKDSPVGRGYGQTSYPRELRLYAVLGSSH
jgi:hypothetical protein